MKIGLDKFNESAVLFVKGALLAGAKELSTKFKLGFALGSGKIGLFPGTGPFETMKVLGVVVDDRQKDAKDPVWAVDVDQFKACVEGGFQAAGELRVDAIGASVEKSEADRFVRLLETGHLD